MNYQRLIQTPSIVLHKRDTTCIYNNNCVATYHDIEVRRQNLPPPPTHTHHPHKDKENTSLIDNSHRQFYVQSTFTCTKRTFTCTQCTSTCTCIHVAYHTTSHLYSVPVDHITGKDQHSWQGLGGEGFKIYSHDQYPTQVCFVHTVSPWKPHYIHAGMYINIHVYTW